MKGHIRESYPAIWAIVIACDPAIGARLAREASSKANLAQLGGIA
jgi:hypothetical protein